MSLIKKADVKNHFSTAYTSVYPFGLKPSDTKTAAESKDPGTQASGSHPASPEAVPNAQVGGSVGVPVNSGKPSKGSW